MTGKVAYRAGKARLLVIDDEVSLGELIRRTAETAGFEVAVAATHDQFLALYDSFGPTAILLDLVMPEIDGVALLDILAHRNCTARIILMTGYHPDLLGAASRLGTSYGLEVRGRLRKPFGTAELEDALRSFR